jgi:hypothetical protein
MISGGVGGDGVTRADAVQFTGGSNSFTLAPGYSIVGNVVGTGTDTFQLGGSTGSATFDLGPSEPASNIGASRSSTWWARTGR